MLKLKGCTYAAGVILLQTGLTIAATASQAAEPAASTTTLSPVSEVQARAFVDNVGGNILAILQEKKAPLEERKKQFRNVLREKFDLASIGRFVMGRYWRQATENQRKDYLSLFENDLVESYAAQFDAYNDETFEVTGHRPSQDGGIIIKSRINRPSGGEPLPVDWKVFSTENGLRVFDIIVNGVSMSITQRTDYAGMLASAGSIDGFIELLRNKQKGDSKGIKKAAK